MKPQHFLSVALIFFAAFSLASTALAQGEPTIAPEVDRLIADEGIDAAKARFDEMAKSDSLDFGPWWMRSASEMVFTYADSFQNFSMEFELDKNEGIHVMNHELEGIGSPLEWTKELPREYGQCIERRGR